MPHPFFDVATPIVIGHRGCAGEAPENTLLSFARALEAGAAILESDVHLTRDGVPVLLHDDVVDRTTDGSGRVAELSLAAAARARRRPSLQPGRRPHATRSAAAACASRRSRKPLAAFPDARFNLELKEGAAGPGRALSRGDREAGSAPRTLLTAGDDALMAELRARGRAARPCRSRSAPPRARSATSCAARSSAGRPPPARWRCRCPPISAAPAGDARVRRARPRPRPRRARLDDRRAGARCARCSRSASTAS